MGKKCRCFYDFYRKFLNFLSSVFQFPFPLADGDGEFRWGNGKKGAINSVVPKCLNAREENNTKTRIKMRFFSQKARHSCLAKTGRALYKYLGYARDYIYRLYIRTNYIYLYRTYFHLISFISIHRRCSILVLISSLSSSFYNSIFNFHCIFIPNSPPALAPLRPFISLSFYLFFGFWFLVFGFGFYVFLSGLLHFCVLCFRLRLSGKHKKKEEKKWK